MPQRYKFGPFWEKKMARLFKIVDFDKDGNFTEKDLVLLANKHIEIGHLDDVQAKKVHRKCSEIWKNQYSKDAVNGCITVHTFAKAIKNQGRDVLDKALITFFGSLFDTLDSNGSGYISLTEFTKFCRVFALSDDNATYAFNAIDTDKDGKISAEEYIEAAMVYHTSEDESDPGNSFYGPLDADDSGPPAPVIECGF